MKIKLNCANITMLAAFMLFLLCLRMRIIYPDSKVTEGFLFAAEAALVGGFADWFAVTALFEKPLGIPWHTALLPRRRPEFSRAAIKMIQQEFLSRRRIIQHLEKLHLFPMLLKWLAKNSTKEEICRRLKIYLENFLKQQNNEPPAKVLAEKVRQGLNSADLPAFFAKLGKGIIADGRDHEILAQTAAYLRQVAAAPATRESIRQWLEKYERERAQSPFELLMAGLAEAFDLVNLDEAAELLQRQLVKSLTELGEKDSPLQREVLVLFRAKATELNRDENFRQLANKARGQMVAELPLEDIMLRLLTYFREQITKDKTAGENLLGLLADEYDRLLTMLREDSDLHRSIHRVVYDVVTRSALHAQKLVGPTVESALAKMTDEQLNRIIRDKIEPDLLWIRMNGSIVGFVIGLMLYVCFQLIP